MAQNPSNKNKASKTKITQDISTQDCDKKRQNNLWRSRLQSVTHQLHTSFSSHQEGSRDINQSNSVQEPTSGGNLKSPSCNIKCQNRGLLQKNILSYKNTGSLFDSGIGAEEQEPGVFSSQQNSDIAATEVKVEDQLTYCDNCFFNNVRFCENQTEEGQLVNYQPFNKKLSSKNKVGKDSPKYEIITQSNKQNISCYPSSSLHKKVCNIGSLLSKNEHKCDHSNKHNVKLQTNTFGLSSSVPVACILNIASLETSDAEKETKQKSTSHMRLLVEWEKPSGCNILKPNEDALWTVKQKFASLQFFNNQHENKYDETSSNYINCKSELQLSDENMPSLATQLMQKQSGTESHQNEIQRKGTRIREIQQMLQLEKCSNKKENQQQRTHCSQNVNMKLQKKNTLMKQEKPYRQWHRISRIVTSESRFIISPQITRVCSEAKRKAIRSEQGQKSTAYEARNERENYSVMNVEPCIENTNVCTDSLLSKTQEKDTQIRSSLGNSNYATYTLERNTDNGNCMEQPKCAETTEDVTSSNVAGKEVPGTLQSYVNINMESLDGATPDYFLFDDRDFGEMSHQGDDLAVKNKELVNSFVDNKQRGITFTGSRCLNIDYVNTKENSIYTPNITLKTPNIWSSVDAYKVHTSLNKTSKYQLSAAEIPHGIFFSSRARSKSLKSFSLTKRQNKRKHPKQSMDEKYRMRDHSADCLYLRRDITGCMKPRNSVSRVSQVTGPSISRTKKCKVYDDYLKMTPSLVQVCEIRSEQYHSNLGKTSGRFYDMVNSNFAFNNCTTVAVNKRLGRVQRQDKNHETCTLKYRSSSKTSSHSESGRARQNNSQQPLSVCKTGARQNNRQQPLFVCKTKCSIKLHGPGERHKQKYSRLPESKSDQMVLSNTQRKPSSHVNRKHFRTQWREAGQKCKDVQAVADCKRMTSEQLSCPRTEQHSYINDSSEKMTYMCGNAGRLKTKKRGVFSSNTSVDKR